MIIIKSQFNSVKELMEFIELMGQMVLKFQACFTKRSSIFLIRSDVTFR